MSTSGFRFQRLLLVVILVCGFAAAGLADNTDMHIVFDPPTASPQYQNLYTISSPDTVYPVSWLSCSAYSGFNPAPNYDACLGFFNNTGTELSSFEISFTVPPDSVLVGQPLNCTTSGPYLTDNAGCPTGNLYGGENVNISFFGGESLTNGTVFFVGEDPIACNNPSDGLTCTSLPPTSVNDPAPEPGTLLLFLPSVLLVLGLAWRRMRRSRAAELL